MIACYEDTHHHGLDSVPSRAVNVNAKISMGLGAGELLQSSGGELGASFTWSRTYMELLARERTVETSTEVEP